MEFRTFFVSLLAVNIVIHLLRLPNLILENGGGAFLILFMIVLHIVALPLILSEVSLQRVVRETRFKDLLVFKKASTHTMWVPGVTVGLRFLQLLMLFLLVVFCVFMTGLSFMYMTHFMGLSFRLKSFVLGGELVPPLNQSLLALVFLFTVAYQVFKRFQKVFLKTATKFILPFCFSIFLVVFVKVLLSINGFQGLKALFYPDFSQLKLDSLLLAIGHALICMFVSLNFFNSSLFVEGKRDPVRVVIHGVIQSIFVALFIGVFAQPMFQQSSETSYGVSWIFSIFPRWLSYSPFGYYYCFLFYFALGSIFFYLSILCLKNTMVPLRSLVKKESRLLEEKLFLATMSVVLSGVLILYQQPLKRWWGKTFFVSLDNIFVNYMLPVLGVGSVWLMFIYTSKKERMALFQKQQVFFHNTYFFKVWEKGAFYFVPSLILIALVMSLF